MDLSLYFLYFSTYCTSEICTKVYSFWKKRKKTWERQVHQNHVTGPFNEKSYSLSIPLGGVTQMTMFNPDTDCTYVCFVTLLPTSWTWEQQVWKYIGGSHYDIGLDSLKGIFIKVCLQNFTREKEIYRGGHDELGRKLHTCIQNQCQNLIIRQTHRNARNKNLEYILPVHVYSGIDGDLFN